MSEARLTHYRHPELYAALLDPDDDEWGWIDALVRLARAPALGGVDHVSTVLDPACGPGSYLLRWARRGCVVCGIDREPAMVEFAAERLSDFGNRARVIRGDMRDPVGVVGDVDLVLNLNASVGHLQSDVEVSEHLRAMRDASRLGAGYLLGVTLLAGDDDATVSDLQAPSFVPLSDGHWGALSYRSLRRQPAARRETIEVRVAFDGADPTEVVERYALHTHTPAGLRRLVSSAGFSLIQWADATDGTPLDVSVLASWNGDAIAVLRAV